MSLYHPGSKSITPCVFPNKDGSELVFTLYHRPDVSDQEFAEDAKSVERLSAVKDFTWKNKFPSTRNDIFMKTADEPRNQKVPGNLTLID
jgi:hypothetical protein